MLTYILLSLHHGTVLSTHWLIVVYSFGFGVLCLYIGQQKSHSPLQETAVIEHSLLL